MNTSTPFVCDDCKAKQTNWYGPCPHAPTTEPAYTEQDLQRAKSFVIGAGGVEICLCPDENCRPRFESELAAEFARIRSEARAGMREACAGHRIRIAHDYSISCSCGWQMSLTSSRPQGLEWEEHIRSLPDLAADEAIERIKREARLPLTADLAAMVNYRYLLRDVTERLLKYAENVYPRCPDDSERELEAAEERRALIADAKTILYETGIAALSGKETA